MRPWLYRLFWLLIGLGGVISIAYVAFTYDFSGNRPVKFGVTFSPTYAEHLGVDWRQAYLATLDDLGVRALRLPVYWNDVEPQAGKYDFADLDWMLQEAAKRKAEVILAIGLRVPRWPECHQPDWVGKLSAQEQRAALLAHLTTTIERYRSHPEIVMWQVENEPFLSTFGVCPPPDKQGIVDEVALVRGLDSRPVMLTDSGELGTWLRAGKYADVFGTTMYRVVWNQHTGFLNYWFVPPALYRWKADLLQLVYPAVDRVIISELQAEPWATGVPLTQMSLPEQQRSFTLERFQDAVAYARQTGISEVYLWGVEYWYWLKQQGHPEVWQDAKTLW